MIYQRLREIYMKLLLEKDLQNVKKGKCHSTNSLKINVHKNRPFEFKGQQDGRSKKQQFFMWKIKQSILEEGVFVTFIIKIPTWHFTVWFWNSKYFIRLKCILQSLESFSVGGVAIFDQFIPKIDVPISYILIYPKTAQKNYTIYTKLWEDYLYAILLILI